MERGPLPGEGRAARAWLGAPRRVTVLFDDEAAWSPVLGAKRIDFRSVGLLPDIVDDIAEYAFEGSPAARECTIAVSEGPPEFPERRVCVYCASSRLCASEYYRAAYRLGSVLADNGFTVVYGGGGVGSMGALADGAIARRGRVIGIVPRFIQELELAHQNLSELQLVEDLRTRKHLMLSESYAVVALPGGCGTLEELLEAITLKRLGVYFNPIVLVNTLGFFNPLLELLSSAVQQGFMDEKHRLMWQVVSEPEEVPAAFASAPPWSSNARKFANP